jgi:DNA ligase (NAD+)
MVTRRGGVIPHVEFVTEAGNETISITETCPSCGGAVTQQSDFLYCLVPQSCPDAIVGTLAHYCSVIDIQGFGDKVLRSAFEAKLLANPADLYRLTREALEGLERVGPKLAAKLIEQIDDHRQLGLANFLRALGIQELGKSVSGILQARYETLERVRALEVEELAEIHGLGEIIAKHVVQGLGKKAELIDQLVKEVTIIRAPPRKEEAAEGPFSGQSFVFTGKLVHFDRKSAQKEVRARGGETPSGVSKELNYLVVGEGKTTAPSSKEKKAEKLAAGGSPLQVISEGQFREMLEGN